MAHTPLTGLKRSMSTEQHGRVPFAGLPRSRHGEQGAVGQAGDGHRRHRRAGAPGTLGAGHVGEVLIKRSGAAALPRHGAAAQLEPAIWPLPPRETELNGDAPALPLDGIDGGAVGAAVGGVHQFDKSLDAAVGQEPRRQIEARVISSPI
jgi:hypothetical protein